MIFIPLLGFTILLIAILKKNGFDLSAFITLSFVVTSFVGVVLHSQDQTYLYGNYSQFDVSFFPVFFYTFLISLCILPFYRYNTNKNRSVKVIKNTKLFDKICIIYIITFFALLVVFSRDIVTIFVIGNFGELRDLAYEGELQTALDSYSGVKRIIGTLLTVIGDGAFFMLIFFFYSLCFLSKKFWFNFLVLLSSLSPVIIGFVNIDRSKTTYWIMLFAMTFFMFRPYFTKQAKSSLRIVIVVVVGALLLYLGAVTISRFGDMDEGTSGGLLSYLGQPVLNFCEIWNKVDIPRFKLERVLPLSSYFILGENGSGVAEMVRDMYSKTGVHMNVFFSFVGMFLVDMGKFGAIFCPLMIYFITNGVVNRYYRKTYTNLSTFIIIFALATIPQCGIITYFYTTIARAVNFWIFIYLASVFKRIDSK